MIRSDFIKVNRGRPLIPYYNRIRGTVWIFLLLGFFVYPNCARAASDEKILDFHSRIEVHTDGHLVVTETIKVVASGDRIKRGIYREFPTDYVTDSGEEMRVGFKVLSVSKEGRSEPYHTERQSKSIRIYFGEKNTYLKPEIYTYTFIYQTDRQLGFFADHDELYWNVTGNRWEFEIEKARATVILPEQTEILKATAYTGRHGSKEQAFVQQSTEMGDPTFTTTHRLKPYEGLTIVVAWPKGVVDEPTLSDQISSSLRQNAGFIFALIGFITMFAYYLNTWVKVGRDPAKGTIIPRFKPPDGFSPAAVRYVDNRRFDKKSLAVALVSLAIKGALRIKWDDEKIYTLEKTKTPDPALLSKGEKGVLKQLFGEDGHLELRKNKYQPRVQQAVSVLQQTLNSDLDKACFVHNAHYLIPGVGIIIAMLIGIILTSKDIASTMGMSLWLGMWTSGCFFLAMQVLKAWRKKSSGLISRINRSRIFITLFTLPFLGAELAGIFMFSKMVSSRAALFFIAAILLTFLFYYLLKAPTLHGRAMLDQIEGFRQYLTIAESERLKILNPPVKTPELFEKFLPYAMALDVEKEWTAQFETLLQQANNGQGHRMGWYHGGLGDGMGTMADNLGHGLSSAVASSAVAPGSSSGFGGGGSSGGGGGGGGGGGW